MSKAKIFTERGTLGELVVTIELVLVSVVQGVALSALAVSAASVVDLEYLEYWPYILTGFLFALFFWSEAISHTLSFIDWPIRLQHTFLYFVIGFFQVVAFSNVTDTLVWFWVFLLISIFGGLLYLVDLSIVKEQRVEIAATPAGADFYEVLLREQKLGLYVLIPLTVLFNVAALLFLYLYPGVSLEASWHVPIAVGQGLFTLGALLFSVRNFKKRAAIIADLYGSKEDRLPEN